jgi:hypothetical protein
MGVPNLFSNVAVTIPFPLPRGPGPERLALPRMCRRPASVADLAADLDLPVGVVQVLADLRERSLIQVHTRHCPPGCPTRRS